MLLNAMKNTLLRRALLMLCITVFAQLGYGQQGADEQPSVLEVIRQGESLVSEGYDLIQQGRIQEGADPTRKRLTSCSAARRSSRSTTATCSGARRLSIKKRKSGMIVSHQPPSPIPAQALG